MIAELPEPWRSWAADRPPARHVHLDTAAAGRPSNAVIDAVRRHMLDEAALGAYVAEALAEPRIGAARAQVGELLGMPTDAVAFVESASAGRAALLASWPLRRGDRVAVVPSEWGANLSAFAHRGLLVEELAVEPDGTLDLDGLADLLRRDPPAIVHVTHVASHRPLVQPLAAVVDLCAPAGVPVWVDAAQALGHVATACGADAVYANGRKWLNGPRGVGFVAVAERHWDALDLLRLDAIPSDTPPIRHLDSHDANVAGRVGVAVALEEHLTAGASAVHRRLADVGRRTRKALVEVTGWEVVGGVEAPGAITALRPMAGQDVAATRQRLLTGHGIITTAGPPSRAPREMTGPLLRISPYVDLTAAHLETLRDALRAQP